MSEMLRLAQGANHKVPRYSALSVRCFFILQESVHAACVVTLFAGGLDTLSKNNARERLLEEQGLYYQLSSLVADHTIKVAPFVMVK